MAEFAVYRGVGGGLHRFQLPLPAPFAAQVAKGLLVLVEEEPPSPTPAPASGPEAVSAPEPTVQPEPADDDMPGLDGDPVNVRKPRTAAAKDVWVEWAVYVSDLSEAEAKALTKAELIKRFG